MTPADLLPIALEAAVPMWIAKTALMTDGQRQERAAELAWVVAEHGDNILYRSRKSGDSAFAFNALAEGLALVAHAPGGVTFLGRHWCTDHAACETARGTGNDGG